MLVGGEGEGRKGRIGMRGDEGRGEGGCRKLEGKRGHEGASLFCLGDRGALHTSFRVGEGDGGWGRERGVTGSWTAHDGVGRRDGEENEKGEERGK